MRCVMVRREWSWGVASSAVSKDPHLALLLLVHVVLRGGGGEACVRVEDVHTGGCVVVEHLGGCCLPA